MNRLINSFQCAFRGLGYAIRTEQNIRIHLIVAVLALILGWLVRLSRVEFLIVLLCIGVVITGELLNSAIERLCDELTREERPEIRIIKDTTAAAVLISSLISLVVGLVIFLPHL